MQILNEQQDVLVTLRECFKAPDESIETIATEIEGTYRVLSSMIHAYRGQGVIQIEANQTTEVQRCLVECIASSIGYKEVEIVEGPTFAKF